MRVIVHFSSSPAVFNIGISVYTDMLILAAQEIVSSESAQEEVQKKRVGSELGDAAKGGVNAP